MNRPDDVFEIIEATVNGPSDSQLSFDWEDEAAWGEHPELACGIENPEHCESCE